MVRADALLVDFPLVATLSREGEGVELREVEEVVEVVAVAGIEGEAEEGAEAVAGEEEAAGVRAVEAAMEGVVDAGSGASSSDCCTMESMAGAYLR